MDEPIICPEPACDAHAAIIARWTLPSTHGPVEHVRTRCGQGHVLTFAADLLDRERDHELSLGAAPIVIPIGPG